MNDDSKQPRTELRDQLLAVEPLAPDTRKHLQQELHTMFTRQLDTPRRILMGTLAVFAIASAIMCGALAITEPDLPRLARIALGVGSLFGLSWAVALIRICLRGTLDLKRDSHLFAMMMWGFTVLLMVFFLIVGASMEDRLQGLIMIANGLAFLIGAGVCWLSYRIERAEMTMREKLLQLELRIAELVEQP
jgi:peptidoglycan/LPS O-acetylase OafA/YrhL